MAKRKLSEEFDCVSDAGATESANIHGIVATVSPMKQGKKAKYFEGKLTDGDKHLRIVGFQEQHRSRLAQFQKSMESVALFDCQLKHGRQSDELEVILRSSSRVTPSPKKFRVADLSALSNPEIQLKALPDKNAYDKVSITAKILHLEDPVKVSGGLSKQDVTIADATAAARLTLWESDVHSVREGGSYELSNLVVRSYLGDKYLSMPKEGAQIKEIDDIGEVHEDDEAEQYITLTGVEVAAVVSLDTYLACLVCKSKIKPTTDQLGRCTKCDALQALKHCNKQWNAKLTFLAGADFLTLNVFGTNVVDIAQDEEVTESTLLSAPPFTLTYTLNIVTAIRRD